MKDRSNGPRQPLRLVEEPKMIIWILEVHLKSIDWGKGKNGAKGCSKKKVVIQSSAKMRFMMWGAWIRISYSPSLVGPNEKQGKKQRNEKKRTAREKRWHHRHKVPTSCSRTSGK